MPRGDRREVNVAAMFDAESIALGMGRMTCPECIGTGWWDFGPAGTEQNCVECKGTGLIWVAL